MYITSRSSKTSYINRLMLIPHTYQRAFNHRLEQPHSQLLIVIITAGTQAEELSVQLEMDCSKQLAEKELEYHSSLTRAMTRLKGIQSMISKVSEASKCKRD